MRSLRVFCIIKVNIEDCPKRQEIFVIKRMLLVINPKSGRGEIARKLYKVIELFSRAEYEVTVYPTTAAGDAYACIRERACNFDLVVCAGGDGIMNEAVNAYMCVENPPQLAYIPCGTTNDFAITLKIPRKIMESARSILNGQPRRIDIGVLGGKYFSYVAAFGLFTNIPYTTDQNAKNILGRIAYFLEGMKHLNNISSVDCVVNIDGEIIRGNFMLGIIANSTSIGGFRFNVEKNAIIDDGLFEVVFVRSPKNILELQEIIGLLLGTQANSHLYIQRTAKKVEFSSVQPCDWTVDGEFGGRHKDIVIENLHQILNIVLPPALDQ